ncbi:MAG: alpha/beta hydrolase, partial [Rhizomicrobium sp.]
MLKVLIGALVLLLVVIVGGWLYLRGPEIPFEKLEAKYANADSRYIDLADGVRLHYRDEGRKSAPLLLLVHGGGDNLWTWDGWVKKLGKDYHIIRIDLPGHGLTRAPEDYVFGGDVISQLVEKLHLQHFVIGGSSLGGLASWNYAVAHPEHVRGLILVDSAGLPDTAKTGKAPLAFR